MNPAVAEKVILVFKGNVIIDDLAEFGKMTIIVGERRSFTREQISRSQQLRNAVSMALAVIHGDMTLDAIMRSIRTRLVVERPKIDRVFQSAPSKEIPLPDPSLVAIAPPTQEVPENDERLISERLDTRQRERDLQKAREERLHQEALSQKVGNQTPTVVSRPQGGGPDAGAASNDRITTSKEDGKSQTPRLVQERPRRSPVVASGRKKTQRRAKNPRKPVDKPDPLSPASRTIEQKPETPEPPKKGKIKLVLRKKSQAVGPAKGGAGMFV